MRNLDWITIKLGTWNIGFKLCTVLSSVERNHSRVDNSQSMLGNYVKAFYDLYPRHRVYYQHAIKTLLETHPNVEIDLVQNQVSDFVFFVISYQNMPYILLIY